jgi:hypothetical protein
MGEPTFMHDRLLAACRLQVPIQGMDIQGRLAYHWQRMFGGESAAR